MALAKAIINGVACLVDDAAPTVPLTDADGDGGDIIAGSAAILANMGLAVDRKASLSLLKPPDGAVMVSRKASGDVSITCHTTSGQYAVDWWDGTRTLHNSNTIASKAASNNGMKLIRAYPATAGESLTYLRCNDNALTSLDVSGLTALEYLLCNDNALTSLDVSGLTALKSFWCNGNALTSLNVSGLTALEYLYCYDNALTSLDVSGLTALESFYCNDNALEDVIADGWDGAFQSHHGNPYYPDFENNNLTTDAVYEMLDAALTADPATTLLLAGNPCSTGGVLQDGVTYTAAQLTALAASKDYGLALT